MKTLDNYVNLTVSKEELVYLVAFLMNEQGHNRSFEVFRRMFNDIECKKVSNILSSVPTATKDDLEDLMSNMLATFKTFID